MSNASAEALPAIATLAVLAGGQGSRMGVPKSRLWLGGQPILRFLHGQWAWPGPTLLVTTPGLEHPPGCDSFDAEVIDSAKGEGPLRGILTALEHTTTELTVLATVDMPEIRFQHLAWLLGALSDRPEEWGVMLCGPDEDGRMEPFPCALRRPAARLAREHLAAGRRAVQRLAGHERFAALPAPHAWGAKWRANLNAPSDLEGTGLEFGPNSGPAEP